MHLIILTQSLFGVTLSILEERSRSLKLFLIVEVQTVLFGFNIAVCVLQTCLHMPNKGQDCYLLTALWVDQCLHSIVLVGGHFPER